MSKYFIDESSSRPVGLQEWRWQISEQIEAECFPDEDNEFVHSIIDIMADVMSLPPKASVKIAGMNGARNYALQEREKNDYYATEPKALELLLQLEQFSPKVWECACGSGHLAKVLTAHGYDITATDLVDRGYGVAGIDFLKCSEIFDGDIITNPPYKYAQEFVEKALELIPNGKRVAMFLKLQFLEGKSRRELFRKSPHILYMCRQIG